MHPMPKIPKEYSPESIFGEPQKSARSPFDPATPHQMSRAQEDRIAETVGGRVRPASGAFEGKKGDVVSKDYLIEAKTTRANSIAIHGKWLEKISFEARDASKQPCLIITFENLPPGVSQDWALLPMSLVQHLLKGSMNGD